MLRGGKLHLTTWGAVWSLGWVPVCVIPQETMGGRGWAEGACCWPQVVLLTICSSVAGCDTACWLGGTEVSWPLSLQSPPDFKNDVNLF